MGMIDRFSIVLDKDRIDMDLLLMADPFLPQVARYLNTCYAFAGIVGQKTVAACLVEKQESYYNIVNLAVYPAYQGKGLGREMLLYLLDFVRAQGGRYIETGCGNASLHLYRMFQKAGFRVVGVWPDYFLSDNRTATVENGIVNRDMVRFRIDLEEKKLTTIG